jgi:hypothetical protein
MCVKTTQPPTTRHTQAHVAALAPSLCSLLSFTSTTNTSSEVGHTIESTRVTGKEASAEVLSNPVWSRRSNVPGTRNAMLCSMFTRAQTQLCRFVLLGMQAILMCYQFAEQLWTIVYWSAWLLYTRVVVQTLFPGKAPPKLKKRPHHIAVCLQVCSPPCLHNCTQIYVAK